MTWSTARPCARCGGADRCSTSSEGAAICRTPSAWQPGDRVKQDRAGGEYAVIHGAASEIDLAADRFDFELAAPDVRHAVYTAVAERFAPVASTLAALYRRGFTPDEVKRLGYGRAPDDDAATLDLERRFGRDTLCGTPGFWQDARGVHLFAPVGGELQIPVRDAEGRRVGARIRTNVEGRKYVHWSYPASDGVMRPRFEACAHVALHDPADRRGAAIVTEGEIKADLASLRTGVPCVAIPGVDQWRTALPAIAGLGARRVVVAFDGDARRKPGVAGALQRFAAALVAAGVDVAVAVWPEAHKGIDDLITGHPAGAWAVELHEGPDALAKVAELVAMSGAKPDPAAQARTALERFRAAVVGGRPAREAAFAPEFIAAAAAASLDAPAEHLAMKDAVKLAGVGLREWNGMVTAATKRAKAARLAEAAARRPSRLVDPGGKATIEVDTDEPRVVNEVCAAIGGCESIYQRGGTLVHVVRDPVVEDGVEFGAGTPRAIVATQPWLRERASERARFYRWALDEESGEHVAIDLHPPDWAIRELEARGQWDGVRALEGIVEAPALRRDGSVLADPGYDAKTGLLYSPSEDFDTVPDAPTLDDAKQAAARVLDLFAEFPLPSDDHRAAVLAAVITPFASHAYPGPAPCFMIDKATPGTGGTLVADVIGTLAMGRKLPRMTHAPDDAEERKRLTALALAATPIVLIDNVVGLFGGANLDAMLTGTEWSDRELGVTRQLVIPWRPVIITTGNNISTTTDRARRCIYVRMESPVERPDEQGGWKYPDLLAHVLENRASLVCDVLTVLRAFCLAGRPSMSLRPMGSFEGWSALVRAAVVWSTGFDPCATRTELREQADAIGAALPELLAGWAEVAGRHGGECTVRQAIDELVRNDNAASGPHPNEPRRYSALRDALSELLGTPPGKLPSAKQFSGLMRRYRARVVGGRAITSKENRDGVQVWTVRSLVKREGAGFAGCAGSATAGPRDESARNSNSDVSHPRTVIEKPAEPAKPAGVDGTPWRHRCAICRRVTPEDELDHSGACPQCSATIESELAAGATEITITGWCPAHGCKPRRCCPAFQPSEPANTEAGNAPAA